MKSQLLIIKMWTRPWPALAALLTMAAIFLWPALPLRGLGNWLMVYTKTTYLFYLYPIIALLSGIYVGLYVYHKKITPCCSVGNTRTGFFGSLTGILLGACPACIPAIAIFLPMAFNVFLSRVAPIFSVVSVIILLWAIYRMNAFKR